MAADDRTMRVGRAVEARGLWKSYGRSIAVRDVSFTLAPGEFLTLLGPSGSGKTTSLMMVAGFEVPTRGEIWVNGQDVAALPPERRNFGVVFQGYALFPQMTVQENVEFALRMRKVGAADRRRRALAMIDKVGLSAFAGRKPRELSGGQQQRVALARALVFEPDALLLDEPLGALDRKLRESLQVEIKEIQERVGISILFVTHDQDEAMSMSDRIAVMADGRIVQIGDPQDLYRHPISAFVAGFLGETNLLPATVRGSEGGRSVVEFADGTLGRARVRGDGSGTMAGQRVLVSVRPERIRMSPAGPLAGTRDGANLSARVKSCSFLGRHARFVLDGLGRTIAVSSVELSLGDGFGPGTAVSIGWTAEDAQMLCESDAP